MWIVTAIILICTVFGPITSWGKLWPSKQKLLSIAEKRPFSIGGLLKYGVIVLGVLYDSWTVWRLLNEPGPVTRGYVFNLSFQLCLTFLGVILLLVMFAFDLTDNSLRLLAERLREVVSLQAALSAQTGRLIEIAQGTAEQHAEMVARQRALEERLQEGPDAPVMWKRVGRMREE